MTGCGGSSEAACGTKIDAVFWGGAQWLDLAKGLAANPSDCVEYYISIPPKDADKTLLRGRREFRQVRALGDHLHPVAEIRFTSEAGWRDWVTGPDAAPGRTFYEAGVEARRRMAKAGLDVASGETWALNELDQDVVENVGHRREEIREFVRGLYDGAPGMPKAAGIVFNIGVFSDLADPAGYKTSLERWLTDGQFWSDLDKHVELFADEVYATPATWGVPGSSLEDRTRSLEEFFYHLPTLAEVGPSSVEPARRFLRRTFVPLVNAAWPHEGLGETNKISAETMSRFVSAQVYSMRRHSASDPSGPGSHSMGFAWAPDVTQPSYTEAGRDAVLQRLAAAVHDSASGPATAACGSNAENDWCNGDVEGASANDVWKTFATWD